MKKLIVIEGPTASGKTSLSVKLAQHFNTCVVSADSRQFYKELSIGTAKPTKEEQDGVQHYFIDSHSVENEVSAAVFEKEALLVLKNEFQKHDLVILTGGSGMFIDALCIGLDKIPSNQEVRSQLNSEWEQFGLDALLNELKTKDPVFFEQVDKNNPMRVIRALEAIRISGIPYSELRKAQPKKRDFEVIRFVIDHDRKNLYDRINRRVDIMMKNGLLEEVKSVVAFKNLPALNTVGYKELFAYLGGKVSLDEAVEQIKTNTRRYAKRQLTWFRRHPEAIWIPFGSNDQMVSTIVKNIE